MTDEGINMVTYFWQEKQDLERCIDWQKRKPIIAESHPELIKAWEDYKTSIKMMNAVVKSLSN